MYIQYTPVEFVRWQSGWKLERGQHGDWVEVPNESGFVRAGAVARVWEPYVAPAAVDPVSFIECLDDYDPFDWFD